MRRLFAATLLIALAVSVSGCGVNLLERSPHPQAHKEVQAPPKAEAQQAPAVPAKPEQIAKPAQLEAPATAEAAPAGPPGQPLTQPPTQPATPAEAAPAVPQKVAVAILVPLTGTGSDLGQALLDAAEMAAFDIGDANFTLLPRDTGGTPDGAAKAAADAIAAGAKIILGPLRAQEVAAVAPIAREAGVPVIAFSNDRTVAGNGVYLIGLLPRDQVDRVVSYAVSQGDTRFAAIVPDTPFGSAVTDALHQAAEQDNASVTAVETYDPSTNMTDLVKRLGNYDARKAMLDQQIQELEAKGDEISRQAAERLKSAGASGDLGFDAIMIPEGGEQLRAIAPLLPYYDIDTDKVKLLGTSLWNDVSLGTEPSLHGGWFAAPDPGAKADFIDRFKILYGSEPSPLASLGYDATALAAVLARSPSGPDFSAAALTAAHGYEGVDGLFRFHPDGLSEYGLAVLQVQRGAFKVISPAPQAFTTVVY